MRFDAPVSEYMSSQVESVRADASLAEVARRLGECRISALPIVPVDGTVAGVVSRSDLLRVGRLMVPSHERAPVLQLPTVTARDVVTGPAITCSATTSLRSAAREMVQHRIHRLFVVDERRRLIGVISTLDLAAAVRDNRVDMTLSDVMTSPVVTVPVTATLDAAVAQLNRASLTSLVVVDERWPIGMFTQADAMAARDLPRDTPIEDLYDPAIICMQAKHNLRYAAAQAARLDVRRVVACTNGDAVGIVSGLDFARVVAG